MVGLIRVGRGPTAELLQLYALEGFLARLAASDLSDRLVLKVGLLLAAFDTRRPTRDADLTGFAIDNDTDSVLAVVREILDTELDEDDGLRFFPDSLSARTIREHGKYSGVRVDAQAHLAIAEIHFHVDVSVGDPVWPGPARIMVPRLRSGNPIKLNGYPLPMVLAEKTITAAQRGTASTRWRDFADIWVLSRQHPLDGTAFRRTVLEVAQYRDADLKPLVETLDGFAEQAQVQWANWRQGHRLDQLPKSFETVLTAIVAFADPVIADAVSGLSWDPQTQTWS